MTRIAVILAGLAMLLVIQPHFYIRRYSPYYFPRASWDLETTAQPSSVSPLPKRGNTAAWILRGLHSTADPARPLPEVHFQASVIADDTVMIYTWIGPWPHPTVTLPKRTLHPGETLTLTEFANYGVEPVSMRLIPAKRPS
jgi:hypothetical protein